MKTNLNRLENINNFTNTVGLLATATNLTAEEAANALARMSNAFNLPINQAANLANAINQLENTTAANSEEIVKSMVRVGAAGANLCFSVDEIAALSTTLIAAGMRSERAGTRLRAAFTKMTSDTEEFAKAAGLSIQEWTDLCFDVLADLFHILRRLFTPDAQGPLDQLSFAGLFLDRLQCHPAPVGHDFYVQAPRFFAQLLDLNLSFRCRQGSRSRKLWSNFIADSEMTH